MLKKQYLLVLFLVIQTLKKKIEKRVVSSSAVGAERFWSIVVCWLIFERVMSAGVASCHPKPERTKLWRSKKRAVSNLQLGQIGFDRFLVCWLVLKALYLLVLLLVTLNLKEKSFRVQKSVLHQILQLGPSGFESIVVCWLILERVVSAGVASCHPQRTKPSRSKERAVSILQLGQSVFESFVVCWLNSERVMSAGVVLFLTLNLKERSLPDHKSVLYTVTEQCLLVLLFCHPKPERAEPSRSKSRAVSNIAVG